MGLETDRTNQQRYATCIENSKRVRWDIETDVIQNRVFDRRERFLPAGLSLVDGFATLNESEKTLVSQIQGLTYANMFGFVERYINAKILEISSEYWLGDQVALEALVRFSDEELKHQALFARIDQMIREVMPDGYAFDLDANSVADVILQKSTWAVLTLTLHIELFTQQHYRHSIAEDAATSQLYRDVFRYHWLEESQHAILDELELRKFDARLSADARDQAVDEFIELVAAVDGLLQVLAEKDSEYLARILDRDVPRAELDLIEAQFLKAYRWQYIHSGAGHPKFVKVMNELLSPAQFSRIGAALETLN